MLSLAGGWHKAPKVRIPLAEHQGAAVLWDHPEHFKRTNKNCPVLEMLLSRKIPFQPYGHL